MNTPTTVSAAPTATIPVTDQAAFLRSVPTGSRGAVGRAFAGTASPRSAIKAKCLDCCHFERAEVAACTVILCPLHPYRPFQKAQRGSESGSLDEISTPMPPRGTWALSRDGAEAKTRSLDAAHEVAR